MSSNKTENLDDKNKIKTILIIGVSSFVGSSIAEYLKHDFKIVGTYHRNPTIIEGVVTVPCDVLSKDEVQFVLYAFKPDITIYCAGLRSINLCDEYENLADAINTSGFFNVNEFCQRYKSQICYLSSAHVFDGVDKNNIEMDIPYSNTVYGKSQAAAEFFLQKTSLNYLVFRCCNLYGLSSTYKAKNYFEKLQKNFNENKSFTADNLVSIGFLDIYFLAAILKMSFKKNVSNRLFQLSSKDSITHYEFAKLFANVFEEDSHLISKGRWKFPIVVQGKKMVSSQEMFYRMDTLNVESFLNIDIPSVKESLEFTFKRLNGVKKTNFQNTETTGVTYI